MGLLTQLFETKNRILVITGAGCSTESGIPDYRDKDGAWKYKKPIQHQDFLASQQVRKRYWARSMVGWRDFGQSQPNIAHRALATLEQTGSLQVIVTQNVDGLHQRAGSKKVVDLHGRLDKVVCLDCHLLHLRREIQHWLTLHNPNYASSIANNAPDGDATLEGDFENFRIPDCKYCGGALKPDVVFFGDNVPRNKVEHVFDSLAQADAVLVVGSSLMVFSGFRFVRKGFEMGIPIAAINDGVTRADDMFNFKIQASCGKVLGDLVTDMGLNS